MSVTSATGTSTLNSASGLSGSGTLSSPGVGSGLDVNGIVSKLMSIERSPINRIDSQTTVINADITAYGTLKGSLSSLQTAVQTLTNASTYSATKTAVSDTAQLSATSSSTAATGTHSILVTHLASSETVRSAAFTSASDSIGTGTLTFDFGTYSADANSGITSFTTNTSKKSVSVTIPSGSNSLNSIADAINAAKVGVNATVLNDGTNNYLAFSPIDGGSANSLRISVNDGDGNNLDNSGLSKLAFDKTTGNFAGGTSLPAPATAVSVSAAASSNKFNIAVDGGAVTAVTIPDGSYDAVSIVAAVQTAVNSAVGSGNATVSLNGSNQLVITSALGGGGSVALTGFTGNSALTNLFGSVTPDAPTGSEAGSVGFVAPVSPLVIASGSNDQFKIAVNGGTAKTVTLANNTYDTTNIVAAMQTAVDSALGTGVAKVSLNASNQLVIASTATSGTSSVALSEVSGNSGLSTLFGASGTAVTTAQNMTETVVPHDATLTVDGVAMTKSSNTITDAIRGVTLNLLTVPVSGVASTLTITNDNSALSSGIQAFVTAYNSTSTLLSSLLSYDPTTGKAGALQSEGAVRSIQADLNSALQTLTHGSGLNGLSDIGVSFQRDGSLAFDSTKLDTALSDPTKNVKTLLIGSTPNSTTDGVANKINNALNMFLESSGTLTARTDGLNQELTDFAKQRADLETRMTAIEATYRKKYSDLDTLIASMNQTSTYLTQQLASLPSISGSSK